METNKIIISPLPLLMNLRGYNTEISYIRSMSGSSQLTYTNQGETQLFGRDDLQIEETLVGQLVTASLTKDPAAEILEFLTLLVPAVILSSTSPKSEILTTAILSQMTRKKGQAQTYLTMCLAGTAEQADA